MEKLPQLTSKVTGVLGRIATRLFPETCVTPEYQERLDKLATTLMEPYKPEEPAQGELFGYTDQGEYLERE